GTNNALRELGGVFGIAVLATVFNRPGVYTSPDAFVSGFRAALWVAVAFFAIAIPLTGFLKAKTSQAADARGERRGRTAAGDVTPCKRRQMTGTQTVGTAHRTDGRPARTGPDDPLNFFRRYDEYNQ